LIDPVIVSFELLGGHFTLRWYGLIIGIAVIVGAYITEREVMRRGGKENYVWDMMIWVVIAGIIGARIGYVLNDIAGGGKYYINNPEAILKVSEGGLHIYGAVIGGFIAVYYYTRKYPFDLWLLMDAVAPALLISQALGRLANFINQELYGPPTDLPWGIPISSDFRINPWRDMVLYPEATTRFHPTFAYEMIWNLVAVGIIYLLIRRYGEKYKPGTIFFLWLIFEGVGRFLIEYFRPDQPRVPGTDISVSRIVAALMAIIGLVLLLARFKKIDWDFLPKLPEKYNLRIKSTASKRSRKSSRRSSRKRSSRRKRRR
jgi:phosphatidylglycerol:prolipoprotein diacylglycerol transferase